MECLSDVAVDADGLGCDFLWREGFILIDTGIQGIRVCVGHLPEGVFDDAGGVIAHAQFKKNDFLVLLGVQEGFVAVCGGVPALVLDEFVIGEQVQRCGFAAVRAGGKELGGDAHGFLPAHHFADDRFVVPCFLTAWFGALEQAVVALCVEQALFIKTRLLEAVVDVCGNDEICFLLNELQQVVIDRLRRVLIAVDEDVAAPIGPELLPRGKGIEAAGVHIGKAVFRGKIGEVRFKASAGIGEARRCGESGARADEYRVGVFQRLLQLFNLRGEVGRRFPCRGL